MQENGFTVQVKDDNNRSAIRTQFSVPDQIQACHTAIVDGYVIEGHVPAAELERLLDERPNIVGLAVIGMPPGSPGMVEGSPSIGNFDVISFDENGASEVYVSYP
jgi:hypothetical protein